MKRIISSVLSAAIGIALIGASFGSRNISVNAESVMDKAVEWAVGIANDDSHGYSQSSRWGPDYDCSSLVMSAYINAGVPLNTTYSTTQKSSEYWMVPEYQRKGFTYIEWSKIGSVSNLRKGDILWRVGHTEMYIGDGKNVGAHINENGGVTGGKVGDQTGSEISVTNFSSSGSWTAVLRYGDADIPEPDTDSDEYYPACAAGYTSIVEALSSIGVDSSFSNRKRIALENGITDYTGTASQNTKLLELLTDGKLKNPDYVPSATTSSAVTMTTATTTTATTTTTASATTSQSGGYYSYTYYTKVTGYSSIVDALKSINVDSSFTSRKAIAEVNDISGYTGSAAQNEQLLNLLSDGKLIKSKVWIDAAETTDTTTSSTQTTAPANPTVRGDVNGDGTVDAEDMTALQDWLLGKSDTLPNRDGADVCKDGVIDTFDMVILRRLTAA